MSGVVLRCPNCGTTRPAAGECDACHEAEVRYYCTNHAPGRWLESRTCSECGAGFGDPPRPPMRPPAAPPSSLPPRAGPSPRPAGATSRGRGPAPTPRPPAIPGWPLPGEPADAPHMRPTGEESDAWRRAPAPVEVDLAPAGRALGGCLMRLVLLVVLAFLALIVGISMLGGSLLRLFEF